MSRIAVVLLAGAVAACATGRPPVPPPPPPPPVRPVAVLAADLVASDETTRAAAAWELARAGALGPNVVQALLACLEDPSPLVRQGATWTLGHLKGAGLPDDWQYDTPPKPVHVVRPRYPRKAFDDRSRARWR